MTKIEILDYVVDYFKTHPRGLHGSSSSACTYLNRNTGARCAHSICIQDDLVETVREFAENACDGSASAVIGKFGDEIHKPEFRGHSADFWVDVQTFHDDSDFWYSTPPGNKLTEDGLERLNFLKEHYKNN